MNMQFDPDIIGGVAIVVGGVVYGIGASASGVVGGVIDICDISDNADGVANRVDRMGSGVLVGAGDAVGVFGAASVDGAVSVAHY
ncbi:Hypothetical predicted protein [Octopus vulgaris]|uniref:Uncharacterized protein n=1 Tax=Octopus vulgaris TaxID=6645 RepID=A0AA36AU31_OCTVU|nr:Hypothetical predicted protein [Octopus vulgaris]